LYGGGVADGACSGPTNHGYLFNAMQLRLVVC